MGADTGEGVNKGEGVNEGGGWCWVNYLWKSSGGVGRGPPVGWGGLTCLWKSSGWYSISSLRAPPGALVPVAEPAKAGANAGANAVNDARGVYEQEERARVLREAATASSLSGEACT